jgi:cyclohexadienyl dehydratase
MAGSPVTRGLRLLALLALLQVSAVPAQGTATLTAAPVEPAASPLAEAQQPVEASQPEAQRPAEAPQPIVDRATLARFDQPEVAVGRVLAAVNDRMALMPGVAAVKWLSKASIDDPEREVEVLQHVTARATELGLDVPAVKTLFTEQMRLSKELQQRLHDEWSRAGACAPCKSPINITGLRAGIDTVNEGLLLALYLAAPVGSGSTTDLIARTADALWSANVPAPADRVALLNALRAVERRGSATWDRVKASGVLRIGTTGDYAPFSLETGGKLSGADIELALDLASSLKLYPIFVQTSWPTLMADLTSDRFDIALSGISFTPERAAVARFSSPYHQGGKTILARCAQRRKFDTLAEVDRRRVRVIVNPGGTNEKYVRESLRRATIVVHPENRTTFDEIVAGRADVMITDDVEVDLQSRRHPELCRAMAGTLTQGDKRILIASDERLHSVVDSWLSLASLAGLPERHLELAIRQHSQVPAR